jgi:hypothetical protein
MDTDVDARRSRSEGVAFVDADADAEPFGKSPGGSDDCLGPGCGRCERCLRVLSGNELRYDPVSTRGRGAAGLSARTSYIKLTWISPRGITNASPPGRVHCVFFVKVL